VLGGYVGARFARKANPSVIRGLIIMVSTAVTVAFFLRR
jgi:uncharacterized membrane protein YfcA